MGEKWGLHDSCGVHNLHALPSLVGAFASVIVQGYKGNQDAVDPRQWWYQLLAFLYAWHLPSFPALLLGTYSSFSTQHLHMTSIGSVMMPGGSLRMILVLITSRTGV